MHPIQGAREIAPLRHLAAILLELSNRRRGSCFIIIAPEYRSDRFVVNVSLFNCYCGNLRKKE